MRIARSFQYICSIAALYVISSYHKYPEELCITIRNGEKYLNDYSYDDVMHSKVLRNIGPQAIIDGIKIKKYYIIHERVSQALNSYHEILKSVRRTSESPESFYKNVQLTTANVQQRNECFMALKGIKQKELNVGYNLVGLDIIFKMRKRLILHSIIEDKDTLKTILDLYKVLKFEYGSNADVFYSDSENGKVKHILIERNTLFAINIAVVLKRMGLLSEFRKDFFKKMAFRTENISDFAIFSKINTEFDYERKVISVLDLKIEANGTVSDIVIAHDGHTFGYGLHRSKKLLLKPCFTFSDEKHFVASALNIFDRLTVFPLITHLRAVCHPAISKHLGAFYMSVLSALPSIYDLELEESLKRSYDSSCDDSLITVNTVLKMFLQNKEHHDKIKSLSIIGYNALSEQSLLQLRFLKLNELGLYGNYRLKDCFYTLILFSGSSALYESISHFKGCTDSLNLAYRLLRDKQLKDASIIRGFQCDKVYDEFFAPRPDEHGALKLFFNENSLESFVFLPKDIELETLIVVYKLYRYSYRRNGLVKTEEKIYTVDRRLQDDSISKLCRAKKLILGPHFYLQQDLLLYAVKRVEFYVHSLRSISDIALKNAMLVADQEDGCIVINKAGAVSTIQGEPEELVAERIEHMGVKNSLKFVVQQRMLMDEQRQSTNKQSENCGEIRIVYQEDSYPVFYENIIKSISID
ncbi:hypothetical protein ENBRE01_0916 [Enteropsectra breve]|nr:hypothetical protein ENBRE01_0916 [Enteropsectra breve]